MKCYALTPMFQVIMDLQNSIVIPLHHKWKYLDDCCDLLNEEWPRSKTARMHSLRASCDNLPTSLILVLLEPDTNEELVIGHCKISVVHNYSSACFVESVCILKKFRGKGWGKFIMQETEKYVKGRKGKIVIFLTTTDKQEFYAKLGYDKCEPVSMYGCKSFQLKNKSSYLPLLSRMSNSNGAQERPTPPPLPPPLPQKNTISSITKSYMMKVVS